jgi:hypothetical protein
MNPYSKVDELDIKNIKDSDQTVIYFIKIRDLSLNDLFIDDHGHYWSISRELSLFPKEKNPLTNSPFEQTEWERIEKALGWYRENVEVLPPKIEYKKTQVVPLPQFSMMSIPPAGTPSVAPPSGRNCYLTPVHGFVNDNFYCFPFFSKDSNGCKVCEGNGMFKWSDENITYHWSSPFLINFDHDGKCFPICCVYTSGDSCLCFHETCLMPLCCFGNWENPRNSGCFLTPAFVKFRNGNSYFTSFFGLCINYNSNCYTPVSCCDSDCKYIVSILGFKTENCGVSPIFCLRKNLCCFLGIPICKV